MGDCMNEAHLTVRSIEDAERLMERVRGSAARAQTWILAQTGDPFELMRRMKFDTIGRHPIEDRAINLQ